MTERLPLILHEDDDLLVVNKPPGWNTHAPDPFAGEGVFDWLRHREPSWAGLAILHRLDKVTSGVLVFGKGRRANRSLAEQFAGHFVRKRYLLLSHHPGPVRERVIRSPLVRDGVRYRVASAGEGLAAETCFRSAGRWGSWHQIIAEPRTGRTHQIRVHAAAAGFPILGDTLYHGAPFPRVCLHAESLGLRHPATGESALFSAPAEFDRDPSRLLREAILDPALTNACRLLHGAADGGPGWVVERLGAWLLSQSAEPLTPERHRQLEDWRRELGARGVFHKVLDRHVRERRPEEAAPLILAGQPPDGPFAALENGLTWELAFDQGYSYGLFLDQRDNRRRLLTGHVAAGWPPLTSSNGRPEVLNLFAYTCAFSVAAAQAGGRVTSVDLSRRYLEWGRRNFTRNGLLPEDHEFLVGNAFDWLRRLARKERRFDVVILDPPTFATGKRRGRFTAARDYGKLVTAAAPLIRPGGRLLAATNAGAIRPAGFPAQVEAGLAQAGRHVVARHYAPQPPDFPITREQPAHLKTLWAIVE